MQRQNRNPPETTIHFQLRTIHKFPPTLSNKILQPILPIPQIASKLQGKELQKMHLHAHWPVLAETEHSRQGPAEHELNVFIVLVE